jgi:hypothetical protein
MVVGVVVVLVVAAAAVAVALVEKVVDLRSSVVPPRYFKWV